jgi:DNA polymerase-3 subunit gamma/tau
MSESLFENPSNSRSLALARKWRPRDFSTLLGQDHVVKALSHALDQQRLHHAWLFTGTRGVGKTTISRILAKSLNCIGMPGQENLQPTSTPCGQCSTCLEIDAGNYVDYIEMDAASNRGVNEMAALLEKVVYGPTSGRFKVIMIDEVHMLTNQAFNSMLKTLEEPPPHIKFILATTDPQKIPVTVLSRCLQFNLKQMPASLIVTHLEDILKQEGVSSELQALRVIAKAARGSMRDALSLTDQAIAYASGNITGASVRQMLGTLDDSYIIRLLWAIHQGRGDEINSICQEMESQTMSFSLALQDIASLLQKVAMAQIIPSSVVEEWPEAEEIVKLAKELNKEDVQLFYQIAITSNSDLELAPSQDVGFMMALLRMMAFKIDTNLTSTQSKVAANPSPSATLAKLPQSKSGSGLIKPKPIVVPEKEIISSPVTQELIQSEDLGKVNEAMIAFKTPQGWQGLIKKLSLTGLVLQFAHHTAITHYQERGQELHLQLATTLMPLATTGSITQLTQSLENYLGRVVKIKVEAGAPVVTVAHLEAKDQEKNQTLLEQQWDKNPLLESMKKQFGVQVIEGSIKPLKNLGEK